MRYSESALKFSADTAGANAIGVEGFSQPDVAAGESRRGNSAAARPLGLHWESVPVSRLLARAADAAAFAVAYLLLAAAVPIMFATAPITRVSSGDIHDD